MKNRVFTQYSQLGMVSCRPAGFFLTAATLYFCLAVFSTVLGQTQVEPVTIAPEALPAFSLEAILDKGKQLENSRHWGEALSHYEDALREHVGNGVLLERHDIAKLHYSFDRRYNDRSFRQSIASLNAQQALSLYSELLLKLSIHYVHVPRWQELGHRGIQALEIALDEPRFQNANRLSLQTDRVAQFRQEALQLLNRHSFASSDDLVEFVSDIAQQANAQLDLPPSAAILEFVAAAANGLDNYSVYLTADQLREVYSQIEGNFVGLGVELKAEDGALRIVHVIPGSPAERSGIVEGDRIVAVDGKSTEELSTDEAAAMLTGVEGSWVRITAYSPGKQPRVINVRREHVAVPSLEDVKIIDPDFGIAYLRIPAFQKTTSRDLEAALWDLHRKGMRSLILDMRGNPGGLLTAAVEVADKFLTQGNIVSTRGRNSQEDFNYQAHYGGTWRVPLVVLIDGDSASASEIFAGAIKDNNRGVIVGRTSFGKGSVQGIFPLGYAGAGVRLTTAKFFSPNGTAISQHGVKPDVLVRTTARPTATGLVGAEDDDVFLQAAIEAARGRTAAR